MRMLLLPAPLLFVLLLQTGSSVAIDNDFSSYPEGAQQCLYDSASEANCTSGSSGTELNQCLCKNKNNFVYNTASCIAKTSPSDADAVYETLSSNCAGTGVTLSVPKQAFLAAATQTTSISSSTATTTGATTGTATASTTATSTPTTTNATDSADQNSSNNGLSTGTEIAIGVGVGFGAIAVALAAWFIWAYQRRRRSAQSVHSNDTSGSTGAFGMANDPHHEYAHNNTQQNAAELTAVTWEPPTRYTTPVYTIGEDKKDGTPLLAELGNESEIHQKPVELPADMSYLGYVDRSTERSLNTSYGHSPVTPEGISPATYSHSRRGDPSPVTPSWSSESGTYR
ncbi:hypothetical protein GGR51DRAFT_564896 [Nemania sp. FL0031]|nr:hypothetical protein GGR51DRAFT_564896 [Nemania sp. FL0031]